MTRICLPTNNCASIAVESAETGRKVRYPRQKDGTVHVDNPAHVKALMDTECFKPSVRVGGATWVCECGWRAHINHCSRCGREDLTKEP